LTACFDFKLAAGLLVDDPIGLRPEPAAWLRPNTRRSIA